MISVILKLKNGNEARVVYIPEGALHITWCINDFLLRAKHLEDLDGTITYDRSKFKDALTEMIQEHDATVGINWEVIEFWLNKKCKV